MNREKYTTPNIDPNIATLKREVAAAARKAATQEDIISERGRTIVTLERELERIRSYVTVDVDRDDATVATRVADLQSEMATLKYDNYDIIYQNNDFFIVDVFGTCLFDLHEKYTSAATRKEVGDYVALATRTTKVEDPWLDVAVGRPARAAWVKFYEGHRESIGVYFMQKSAGRGDPPKRDESVMGLFSHLRNVRSHYSKRLLWKMLDEFPRVYVWMQQLLSRILLDEAPCTTPGWIESPPEAVTSKDLTETNDKLRHFIGIVTERARDSWTKIDGFSR
jgi:hypothetical protein